MRGKERERGRQSERQRERGRETETQREREWKNYVKIFLYLASAQSFITLNVKNPDM